MSKLDDICKAMKLECVEAISENGHFNTLHEGFAFLKEEVDELWEEIKKNPKGNNDIDVIKEAIQVGAMVMAIILKCGRKKK